MRKIINQQVQMGEINIPDVKIEVDNRDEIPQLLRGLQYIYSTPAVWKKVQKELYCIVPLNVAPDNGREGMPLWRIFVLGMLRLICNWDYDKLQEIANNHMTLRQLLGHGLLDFDKRYPRQTLCDNLRLFTPEILERINKIIVEAGHTLFDHSYKDSIHTRCDSFVVETDVHFPTDINLLWDAVRKVLQLTHRLSNSYGLPGWRQTNHNKNKIKRLFRRVQKERDRNKQSSSCLKATQAYIEECDSVLRRSKETVLLAKRNYTEAKYAVQEIERFIAHGRRQIQQINDRCFKGKTIPSYEKVYSVFEEHTEWISKGKAGVPQELGLRVCIVEGEYGFILHHRVMVDEEDSEIAVPIIKETKRLYKNVTSCSFDKGFHSPDNQRDLQKELDSCILPRKGKLKGEDKKREGTEEFKSLRKVHAAVESAINALENHGLDRCCDHGLDGFERYVSMAIVARNIHLVGVELQKRELVLLQKRKSRRILKNAA